MVQLDQGWFEMSDVRARRFSGAIWIPLRQRRQELLAGEPFKPGCVEDTFLLGSVAFPPSSRAQAEELSWTDLGLMHDGGPYAFSDGRYKPCEAYRVDDHIDLGIDLVFDQSVPGHGRVWHLSQDLVLALHLLQEGDTWVCPTEGYAEVVRQTRDETGAVTAIEIRAEYLKDYLAARGLALRLSWYRERMAIGVDRSLVNWPNGHHDEQLPDGRRSGTVDEVDSDGDLHGSEVAVVEMWRTDPELQDDVPRLGPPNDRNTAGRQGTFRRSGQAFTRIVGELWRQEWIEPASRSERVRHDRPETEPHFVVDTSGTRQPPTEFGDHLPGGYLWFLSSAITDFAGIRGAELTWHSREIGNIALVGDSGVQFGLTERGAVNVHTEIIGRLSAWQQTKWAAYNITPNGPRCEELARLDYQLQAPNSSAPENDFVHSMKMLDKTCVRRFGKGCYRAHAATHTILRGIHRLAARDEHGLRSLAKDIARVAIDRLDISMLRAAIGAPDDKLRELKLLQALVATTIPAADAEKIAAPLFGILDLRHADAHLPSSELDGAYKRVGVDRTAVQTLQAMQLIDGAVKALIGFTAALDLDLDTLSTST